MPANAGIHAFAGKFSKKVVDGTETRACPSFPIMEGGSRVNPTSAATPGRDGEAGGPSFDYIRRMIPNEPKVTPELVAEHGLKPDEYERILELIGREPSVTELGIFSAMWNEH